MDISELILREGQRRKLSPRTIKTYSLCVQKFFQWSKKDPQRVTKQDIKEFLTELSMKERAGSTLNVYLQSLKFFFEEILSKRLLYKVTYSKTPKRLPEVLSKQEVKRLFEAISNPKHRLMTELMYSAGLRVSELIHLKLQDLDFSSKMGWVRGGKGNKDRMFILSEKLGRQLERYLRLSHLESPYLFPGRNGTYSQKSLHLIVKRAAKKAGIQKNIHCHTLRHSFATHLVENGYDIASVQSLLGHSSSQTTMIYVHMASPNLINVRSPFDDL